MNGVYMYVRYERSEAMYVAAKALVEKVSPYQFPFIYPIQIRLAVSYTISSIFFYQFFLSPFAIP